MVATAAITTAIASSHQNHAGTEDELSPVSFAASDVGAADGVVDVGDELVAVVGSAVVGASVVGASVVGSDVGADLVGSDVVAVLVGDGRVGSDSVGSTSDASDRVGRVSVGRVSVGRVGSVERVGRLTLSDGRLIPDLVDDAVGNATDPSPLLQPVRINMMPPPATSARAPTLEVRR